VVLFEVVWRCMILCGVCVIMVRCCIVLCSVLFSFCCPVFHGFGSLLVTKIMVCFCFVLMRKYLLWFGSVYN
jgi:hypothetical protein